MVFSVLSFISPKDVALNNLIIPHYHPILEYFNPYSLPSILDKLIAFQKFLQNSHHIQEKHIPYYSNWVNQFLNFSNQHSELKIDLRIQSFLDQLQTRYDKSDWQIRQADNAIRLYLYHFCDKKSLLIPGGKPANNLTLLDETSIIKKVREIIRIKHYSQKTEHTYIHWIKTFWRYIKNSSPSNIKINKRGMHLTQVHTTCSVGGYGKLSANTYRI